ncbi:MAG: insulinase family protein, partial [Proteobacteria bacterium]|nr:insulinase family protein [Pseudomonadota bacterium]
VLKPAFTQQDFDRIKLKTIEELMQNRKTPQGLADRAINAVLFGPDHPLSYPMGGLPSTVENITLDDVKAYYAAHIPAHLTGIMVSASLGQADIIAALQGFAELETSEVNREAIDELPKITGRRMYLVNKEGAAQSSLRTAQPSIKYDALGDFYLAGLMNFTLGGTFNSRLNLNLREDKGYTYGARSRFQGGKELGSFRFRSEVNKETTAASVTEVINELETYAAGGMTEEEYDYMRSAIGQRDALQYETPSRKLALLGNILSYDLPLNYRTQQNNILRETDHQTLNELASRLIQPGNMAIVVVGDEAAIRPQLEALGMPITVLDEDGLEVAEGAGDR